MTKISYRERGSGKVLICLHGYGGSVLHWDKVAADLSQLFKVVTPNLTHLYLAKEQLTFSQQIDKIAEFIGNHFSEQPVFLAGISYGGALAWGISLRYPQLIEKVVFVNPMPPNPARFFSLPMLNWFFRLPLPPVAIHLFLASTVGKFFLQQAANIFRNETRIESLQGRKLQFVTHILWKFSWILRHENWRHWEEQLRNWTHPCLLIYDRKDPLFHFEYYDMFAKILESQNVVTTQDAGHISIVQQPKLIAGAMREYLLRDFYKQAQGYNG
jgi:pimeloyl-ACP methyl ester carboxylesterase